MMTQLAGKCFATAWLFGSCSRLISLLFVQFGQICFQLWDIDSDDAPNCLVVNAKIFVNNQVPQANNSSPGSVGMVHEKLIAKAVSRLPNNLQLVQRGVKHHGVVCKRVFVCPLNVVFNLFDGIQNVHHSHMVGYFSIHRVIVFLNQRMV